MFWGLVLKTGNQYKQVVESAFHISKACAKCLTASCHLVLRHQEQEYILCQLSNENCQVDMNLNFSVGEQIEFFLQQISTKTDGRTETDAEVCLSGYYINEPLTDEALSNSVAIKRSLMNGHAEENVEENEIISIKKRSHDQVNGDDETEFVSRSKKPKNSSRDPERESSGPTATVGASYFIANYCVLIFHLKCITWRFVPRNSTLASSIFFLTTNGIY
ncbi:uncharacterized protein LOC142336643 [Convolutriloba macropyga]|uniref:uncharacterized protein LOC142336643 n=1 Tax=Convolutriloba macropyga TaxID=536237 RepID=UPI003F51EEC1